LAVGDREPPRRVGHLLRKVGEKCGAQRDLTWMMGGVQMIVFPANEDNHPLPMTGAETIPFAQVNQTLMLASCN
jgi:hypothetical protein